MSFRLLVDECLSPELVGVAVAAGYVESTCARDRGLLAKKDWELIAFVVSGGFTLVTHNERQSDLMPGIFAAPAPPTLAGFMPRNRFMRG